eukprot:1581888-Rhodomonas_salina.1
MRRGESKRVGKLPAVGPGGRSSLSLREGQREGGGGGEGDGEGGGGGAVSYTHLRAHETEADL